jgi:uncharacterized membrane protein YccC
MDAVDRHDNQVTGLGSRLLTFTNAGDVGFALRTALAGLAAMFAAMALQLDVPRWAIWTVFIVSPPVRGNVLRKTVSRLAGTAIGCVVGVIIAVMFPQDRAGFLLAFSGWLGLCAYWATLKRGYVSYAASLAAFTSAIVTADVSTAPQSIWLAAVDRGSATFLGTIFAFFASEMNARSDDVPGDLARRVGSLAVDLFHWAQRQLQTPASTEPIDAPLTERILVLDETCVNAMSERPALAPVRRWFNGLPTAMLSIQSTVLSLRRRTNDADASVARAVIEQMNGFLASEAALDVQALRSRADDLIRTRGALRADGRALGELIDAMIFIFSALEAVLTLARPSVPARVYSRPCFVLHPRLAMTNLIRTVVGMLAAFAIWDATAWPQGPIFLINVAVGLVIFVNMEDPIGGNRPNFFGNVAGGIVALAIKYLLLPQANNPLWLAAILLPVLTLGTWAQTKQRIASLGSFFLNGFLVVLEPKNPQIYDFVHDVNVLVALGFAYAFVPAVFLMIGTPRHGPYRICELLKRMRDRSAWPTRPWPTRQFQRRQSEMYDELQKLHAVTDDPAHRRRAINLVLRAWRFDGDPQSRMQHAAANA